MNAPIDRDAPTLKPCARCGIPKENTIEFYRPRADRGGDLRTVCRICMRRNDTDMKRRRRSTEVRYREVRVSKRRGCSEKYEPGPKPCNECSSLPWRVDGRVCFTCGLEHAAEPPVELVLYRSNPRVLW